MTSGADGAADERQVEEAVAQTRSEVEILGVERLIFFSDAVVAIAITLLALALPLPTGVGNQELLNSIGDHFDDYLAFVISFLVIAAHWRGHHKAFRWVSSSRHLVGLNLLWLLFIVIMPYATRVLTGDGGFQVRFTFYAGVQALAGLSFIAILRSIRRHGLVRSGSPPHLVRDNIIQLSGMVVMFAISIPFCYVTRWAYLLWFGIPFSTRLLRGLTTRLFSRAT